MATLSVSILTKHCVSTEHTIWFRDGAKHCITSFESHSDLVGVTVIPILQFKRLRLRELNLRTKVIISVNGRDRPHI